MVKKLFPNLLHLKCCTEKQEKFEALSNGNYNVKEQAIDNEFGMIFFFFYCNTKNTTLQNKTITTYNTTYKTLLILLTI